MALETRLALSSETPVEQRDPQANYHKMTLTDLNALTPGVDWQPYFTALDLPIPAEWMSGSRSFSRRWARCLGMSRWGTGKRISAGA